MSGAVRRGVLMAAGRGTRLGALTASFPKPMLEVAGAPIIGHILRGLAGAGLEEVVIITGHCAELLEQGLGDGERFGLRLRYRRQPQPPEGTAKALCLARDLLRPDPFFFGWGDILVAPANYDRILSAAAGLDALIAVNDVDDPWAGAAVTVDEQYRVRKIVEKPPRGTSTTRWNNAGLGVLGPAIWPHVDALQPSARGEYELPQAISALVESGADVGAVPVHGLWFDIGTAADLDTARREFKPTA